MNINQTNFGIGIPRRIPITPGDLPETNPISAPADAMAQSAAPSNPVPAGPEVREDTADAIIQRLEAFRAEMTADISKHLDAIRTEVTADLTRMTNAINQIGIAAAPADVSPNLDAMTDKLGKLERMNTTVLTDYQNMLAKQLHAQEAELRKYKELLSPLSNAQLLTRIANILLSVEAVNRGVTDQKASRSVSLLGNSLRELLEDEGVTISSSEPMTRRSFHSTQVSRYVPTGDPDLAGLIIASDTPAFSIGSKVLVKESVQLYQYDPALAVPQSGPEIPEETVSGGAAAMADDAAPQPIEAAPVTDEAAVMTDAPAAEAAPTPQPAEADPAPETDPASPSV